MPSSVKLLAFAGSGRADSLNRKLLTLAVTSARAQGAEVTVLELKADTLPLYDGDLEDAGLPPARRLIPPIAGAAGCGADFLAPRRGAASRRAETIAA